MQIELTPEQDDVVRRAIASGRIARPEEAVAQAMADWVERERERVEFIASLDEAEAEYRRGESIRVDSEGDAKALFDDIKATCRARLAVEGAGQR